MTISLVTFLSSGNLGPIHIGSLKVEAIELLGKPTEDNSFHNGYAELVYNGFRLFYVEDTKIIYAILCQDFNDSFFISPQSDFFQLSNKTRLETTPFDFTETTTYFLTTKILSELSIKYTERTEKYWDIITTQSGVDLLFNNWYEYPEDHNYARTKLELYGIRLFKLV